MLVALADALENLADEVMTLDAMGPIEYVEYKVIDFLTKIDDFITDLTTEPKSEEADYTEDDEIWDNPAPESTKNAAEKPVEEKKTVVDIEPKQKQEEKSTATIHSQDTASDEFVPEADTSEMNSEKQDVETESGDGGASDYTPHDDGIEAGIAFCNAHMDKIQEIITDTAKKINASRYSEQQEYLQDVFEFSADKCWRYLEKELAEAKEKQDADMEMLNSITEKDAKDAVILIATKMFLQWAFETLASGEE